MNAAAPDPPDIPPETLRAIEIRFHDLVRQRARELLGRDDVPLPSLSSYAETRDREGQVWFPVSGIVWRLRLQACRKRNRCEADRGELVACGRRIGATTRDHEGWDDACRAGICVGPRLKSNPDAMTSSAV